jgi:hypothetical protein
MTRELDDLAFRFFKLFAQCEYSLKAMGYARAGANNAAEPDWDAFANRVGAKLLTNKEPDVLAALTYMYEQPPKRQVWIDAGIAWQAVPNDDRSAQALFGHIRRVRNNLYHGGKFNGHWLEPDRSQALISKSLLLLETLVNSDADLLNAIQGNAA